MRTRLLILLLTLLVAGACGDDAQTAADGNEAVPVEESDEDGRASESATSDLEAATKDEDVPADEPGGEEEALLSPPRPDDRPSMRGTRYCEILLVFDGDDGPTAEVWGTQGVNLCPPELWEAIDPEAVRAEYDAVGIKMNGPRHMVIDLGTGRLPEADRRTYGDLEMQKLATVAPAELAPASGDGAQPSSTGYQEITVRRNNTWNFYAGSEIYELTDPDGVAYVMQAYSQIVNSDLTENDLASLGERLELPEGWSFEARVLEEDLHLVVDGEAVVIQDELENTYQRR